MGACRYGKLQRMDWKEYAHHSNWHPHANLFPRMNEVEFNALVEDIRANGLQEPIALFEGKVLDGRNRAMACVRADVKPRFVEWHQRDVSPVSYVISKNLNRRHLTITQRVAVALAAEKDIVAEAQERQKAAGQFGVKGGRGKRTQKPSAQNCAKGLGKSSAILAARFGVSARNIEKVRALVKKDRSVLRKLMNGEVTIQQADKELNSRGRLHERFVVPPFTVLDTKQGYWMKRKEIWHAEGAVSVHNEQLKASFGVVDGVEDRSGFDPVLAECIYKWFCPPKGHVLDPCAGEYVKGIVAAKLGLDYTGIEVRPNQVKENSDQAKKLGVSARWILGDSTEMSRYLDETPAFDLVFTSPPYYKTEVYSTNEKDSSTFGTYDDFLHWYHEIFRHAVARLKTNRFLVVKIGEGRRDKDGFFYNLVGDSISCFRNLGLHYYNSAVLLTQLSSNALRVNGQFPTYRKLVGAHQNILCFFKGEDPSIIPKELGVLSDSSAG
jgi:hypothetical protein